MLAMRSGFLGLSVGCVLVTLQVAWGQLETWHNPNTQTSGDINDLADAAAAVRTFVAARKTSQDSLHTTHDQWKMNLDHNTLLQYERRNLQYANNAMQNLNAYYREMKQRNIDRNEQLYSENQAYNASVQFNEALIKYINQSYYALARDSSALDAQNIELMAEVGALRDGNTDVTRRTFGLTRQRQNSVQRKLLNWANYKAIEALAHSMRADKKHFKIQTTRLRGEKNNHHVNNQGLEMHTVTLTAQRNLEETLKLMEVYKKRNMEKRRDDFQAMASTLETSRNQLEADLKSIVIENARLRELNSEYLTHRLDVKKERDLQKWNYVNALLQRHSAVTYRNKMKQLYDAELIERDTHQTALANEVSTTLLTHTNFVSLTDCEEENRYLEQHILSLTQRNAQLRNNCYGQ